MVLRFIHVTVYVSTSFFFIAEFILFIPLCRWTQFIFLLMDFGLFPLSMTLNSLLMCFEDTVGVHIGLAAKAEFKTTVLAPAGTEGFSVWEAGIPLICVSFFFFFCSIPVKGMATKVSQKPVNQVQSRLPDNWLPNRPVRIRYFSSPWWVTLLLEQWPFCN